MLINLMALKIIRIHFILNISEYQNIFILILKNNLQHLMLKCGLNAHHLLLNFYQIELTRILFFRYNLNVPFCDQT